MPKASTSRPSCSARVRNCGEVESPDGEGQVKSRDVVRDVVV